MNRARILVADDHSRSLNLSKMLLETRYEMVGIVGDGLALLAAAQDLKPDVILSNIALPFVGGIAACRRLSQVLPGARVVLWTARDDPASLESALLAGASGYVLEPFLPAELGEAIEEVLRGRTYITPVLAGRSTSGAPSAGP